MWTGAVAASTQPTNYVIATAPDLVFVIHNHTSTSRSIGANEVQWSD
jgi:hypothetical protein